MAEEIGYEVLLSALINSCNHSSKKVYLNLVLWTNFRDKIWLKELVIYSELKKKEKKGKGKKS